MKLSFGSLYEYAQGMLYVPPLAVCVLHIVLTCLVAHLLRKLVQRTGDHRTVWPSVWNEGIAGAELCGCCFELIIVADNYGVWMYALFLFLLTVWWGRVWGDATACPYTYLEDLLEERTNYGVVILKTASALLGALGVFRYIQLLWDLELSPLHKGQAAARCYADLHVPVLYGALIEGVATFLCRLSTKTIAELEPKYGPYIDSFIGTSLVVAAFDYSGGYFNPLLATGLKYGCRGHSVPQFLAVYWIGSILGSVAALKAFKLQAVHDVLVGRKNAYPTTAPVESLDSSAFASAPEPNGDFKWPDGE